MVDPPRRENFVHFVLHDQNVVPGYLKNRGLLESHLIGLLVVRVGDLDPQEIALELSEERGLNVEHSQDVRVFLVNLEVHLAILLHSYESVCLVR